MSATIIATVCRDGQEQYSIASKEDTVLLPEVQAARLRRAVKRAIYWDEESSTADDLRDKRYCAAARDEWARKAEDERAATCQLITDILRDDLYPAWKKPIVIQNLRRLADAAFEDIPADRFDVSKIYHPDYGKE